MPLVLLTIAYFVLLFAGVYLLKARASLNRKTFVGFCLMITLLFLAVASAIRNPKADAVLRDVLLGAVWLVPIPGVVWTSLPSGSSADGKNE